MAAADASPEIYLSSTMGALFYGCVFLLWLYGVATSQCYYFMKCRIYEGKLELKVVVTALWLLETLHLCFFLQGYRGYVVNSHRNPDKLSHPQWELFCNSKLYLSVIGNPIVKRMSVYGRSAYGHGTYDTLHTTVSKSLSSLFIAGFMGAVQTLLSTFGLSVGIGEHIYTMLTLRTEVESHSHSVDSYQTYNLGYTTSFNETTWFKSDSVDEGLYLIVIHELQKANFTPLVCMAVNDIVMTFILYATLQRAKMSVRSTDGIINVFIAFTLNTGLLTCICSVAIIVLFILSTIQQCIHQLPPRSSELPQLAPPSNDYAFELTTIPYELSQNASDMTVLMTPNIDRGPPEKEESDRQFSHASKDL
ncbi:hypothetical protein CONPUDRAFT_142260 [Coniophora puteana RWD-64-598 SS2]|uniref:DUF6534 domain-containing protein n=1 Tax=Coniophora puteana (strain RWD-64-598) TaxID=741705 RepID=A0A5M3MWS4_CONPW|nr:uncharacterized protein CONPUDRAFT_142260 [Coniophora puteana RWD-64-598 SS2]EIW83592.1 hypothetical protein CONPUDRAFT_142260 [Coniophora puteana RWD-64-598 SS2]